MKMTPINNTPEAGRLKRSANGLNKSPVKSKVWDIGVRLFHWFLVTAYAIVWFTADEWDKLHEVAGYAIAALIGFRIIWGFVGSKHARFRDFLYKPSTIYTYLQDSVLYRAKRYIGHNPAGGAMVIALLTFLLAATISGIAMTTNTFWGVEWLEDVHEVTANATLILVVIHVAGVIYSSISHRENLVRSMFTGLKRRGSE